nr:hypothetical protein [Tanacetum cinerariifolium]
MGVVDCFELTKWKNVFSLKKSGGRSSKSVVIQDTPSAPKSKSTTLKYKLKGAPFLTSEEQEAADIMQALKKVKKTSRIQPCIEDSNEGTSRKPGVPNEFTFGDEQDNEHSDDVENDDNDGDADDEGDDHISDTQDADDVEIKSDKDDIYKYKIPKEDVEKNSEAKDEAKKTKLPPSRSSLSASLATATALPPIPQQTTTLIPTPTITTDAPTINIVVPESNALTGVELRVKKLEKDVSELKIIDNSTESLVILKSQVPFVVDNYLGSKVEDVFQMELKKHTTDLIQKYSILYQSMHANKSFKRNHANHRLYHLLMEALIEDENGKKTKRRRTKESESSKKPSSTNETPKGKTLTKGSKTGKSASAKEPVKEPIVEVVMDTSDDVAHDDNQPEDTSEPKKRKTLNPDWFKQPPRPPTPNPEWNKCYRTVVVDYFFNNDLEYLKTFDPEAILGVKSVSVKKLHGYGHLEEIVVKRSDQQLYKFKNMISVLKFHLDYNKEMPKRKWMAIEQKRSGLLIELIDKQQRESEIIRNLERLVGARELEMDYKTYDAYRLIVSKEKIRLNASTKQLHYCLLKHQGFHHQIINPECHLILEIKQPFKMVESSFNKFNEDKIRVILCTQPKRPRNATWFKEKLMLVEAQEAGQILDEEQLACLADPGISEAPVAQQTIPQNSAFQTDDLDAYDSDCDDLSSAKAVLMENLSSCDLGVLSETRVQSKEHCDSLIAKINAKSVENSDLNVQLQEKAFAITALKNELRKLKEKNVVNIMVSKPNATIAPRMFKLDIETISPRLKNNRDAHEVSIKKTIEYTNTLCGFVKHARTQYPSEPILESACMITKHVQEFEDLGKLNGMADIGIFVGYMPAKKAFRIYNSWKLFMCSGLNLSWSKLNVTLPVWKLGGGLVGGGGLVMAVCWWLLGLLKFKYHKEYLCPSCEQGKSKRASHPPKPIPNSRITVLLQSPVIIIRTDNDTEFKNQALKDYFDSVGISHQMSYVRTPQQNGVVERQNRIRHDDDDDNGDDEDPIAGPNQGKKTKRRKNKESESAKKPSTTKETSKGKAPSKGSKTGKSAPIKEPVEKPIAEVVMDDAFYTTGEDMVRDDDQPQDTSEPKTYRLEIQIGSNNLQGLLLLIRNETSIKLYLINLNNLGSTKPDIVHATCLCARYQAKATEKYLKEVKRIIYYLQGTVNTGLWYKKDSGFEITRFSDADYARCKDTFKSTSGGAQFLGENLLTDYGFHFNKIPIYCDSKSAIAISCNPVQHSRTKHIVVRYHFIKENAKKDTIELYFVKTDYQLADLFTKAIPADRFTYLVRRL